MGLFRKKIITNEDIYRNQKKKFVCDFCGKKDSFLENKPESIAMDGKAMKLHRECIPKMREKIEELQKLEDQRQEERKILAEQEKLDQQRKFDEQQTSIGDGFNSSIYVSYYDKQDSYTRKLERVKRGKKTRNF